MDRPTCYLGVFIPTHRNITSFLFNIFFVIFRHCTVYILAFSTSGVSTFAYSARPFVCLCVAEFYKLMTSD